MQPLLFASHGLNPNPDSSQLHHKCALHAAVHFMNSISIGTFNSFQIIVFFGVLYRLKLLKGWVMGGKHLKEMLKCIVMKILQRSFRWYEIALLLLYLSFHFDFAVGFSSYFKVLYKLPCATLQMFFLQLHGWVPKFPLEQGRGDFCVSKQWLLLRKK